MFGRLSFSLGRSFRFRNELWNSVSRVRTLGIERREPNHLSVHVLASILAEAGWHLITYIDRRGPSWLDPEKNVELRN